jgi:alpha-1,2-glucosyltransferase
MLGTTVLLTVSFILNPMSILIQVWPYVMVLISFGCFVLWNGGVVLGEYSSL